MNELSRNSESSPNPAEALGQLLNQARKKRGMSVGEVAECLKLPAKQIEAIERGNYEGMPEAVFVKGFLTSYARLMEIDSNELKQYLGQIFPAKKKEFNPESSNVSAEDLDFQHQPQRRHFPRWILGLVLLVGIGTGIYAWQTKSTLESAKQAANSTQDVTNHAATVSDVAASNIRIVPMSASDKAGSTERLTSSDHSGANNVVAVNTNVTAHSPDSNHTLLIKLGHQSWLQVSDRNDKVLISEVVSAGSSHEFKAEAPYKVIIGYTPGAIIELDGKNVPIPENRKRTATMKVGDI